MLAGTCWSSWAVMPEEWQRFTWWFVFEPQICVSEELDGGSRGWLWRLWRVQCSPAQIFVILIVSADFWPVRTKEYLFVGCVVHFVIVVVFDVGKGLFVIFLEPFDSFEKYAWVVVVYWVFCYENYLLTERYPCYRQGNIYHFKYCDQHKRFVDKDLQFWFYSSLF